jgi:hypothetical protein
MTTKDDDRRKRLRRARVLMTAMSGGVMTAAQFTGLMAATSPLAWWDANRDLYTDTGLTTPAVDGNAVAGWKDQRPSAYHVTQATAGNRPVYRASAAALNNLPAVQFTAASSHYLIKTALAGAIIGNLNVYSIYVVYATSTSHLGYQYSEGRSSNANPFAASRVNFGAAEGNHRDDALVNSNPTGGATAGNGAKHIQTVRRIAAGSWAVRQDGVQLGTSAITPTTTTIDQVAIGALVRNTISIFFDGFISQVIVSNSDNFATIEPILAAYYGIALP